MAQQDPTTEDVIPKGYMKNAEGHLVPVKLVSSIDKKRDQLVRDIVKRAKALRDPLAEFRKQAENEIQAFIQSSADQYDAKIGGKKGNVSLLSFDGRFKVMRTYGEQVYFDERIQAAKALIDECIHKWAKGSRYEIKALVEHAFQTDKQGNINKDRVLGLKKLDIKDEQWQRAMKAITDSMQVMSRKSYVRLYERDGDDGEYKPISLDIAAL
jgi:hypothetical protein